MNNKKKYIIFLGLVLIVLIGVSFAFFNYYKVGTNRELIAGDIYLNMDETGGYVRLNNVFPEAAPDASRARDDNTITFTIDGRNTTTNKTIYYEILLDEVDDNPNYTTRIKAEHLRFDLIEIIDGKENYVLENERYKSLNERRIWVNQVDPNTTEVERQYKLRVWVDENVLISDTDPEADYPAKTWKDTYASVKVSVYGDFEEKTLPGQMVRLGTAYNKFWSDNIINAKSNIVEVKFIQLDNSEIDTRYNAASIKSDVTTNDEFPVKAWLETNVEDPTKYTMYVASEEKIYFPSNSKFMFHSFTNVDVINFNNVDTSQVTDMSAFFQTCENLGNLNLSNFNTSNVTNTQLMFAECKKLNTIIGIENFNTSKVISMSNMFNSCLNIISLDLSGWDTNKVNLMVQMFTYCNNLTSLDISNFTFNSVTKSSYMFYSTGSNLPSGTYTTVYVGADYQINGTTYSPQTWVLNSSNKPSGWSTTNVIVKQ